MYKCKTGIITKIIMMIMMVAICGCISVIAGCDEDKEDKNSFMIYYLNKEENKLVSSDYKLKAEGTEKKVKETIEKLNKIPDKINSITALPSDVKVKAWEIKDNVLNISFSTEYLSIGTIRDVMCRAAYVLTLTQIDGIEYVCFFVDDEPLKNADDTQVGMLKASDFVNSSGSSINTYENVDLVLYFADKQGDSLVEKSYSKVYSKNVSMEKYILEQLVKGPSEDDVTRTLPSDLKIISVITKDGICYVSLDEKFLDENVDVNPEVEIYSIVNSLCELTTVNKVQISINGEMQKQLHNSISLKQLFSRNLDIVKTDSETK